MRLILSLFILVATINLGAAQGIQFAEGSWASILEKAKKENKLIYLDAYASWCGPCKMMAKNVFTLPAVGSFYNENYINVSMDMEKSPDGPGLSQKYGLRAYPTHYIVDGQGELVTAKLGYMEGDDFIKWGKESLDPANQLPSYKKKFESGDRSKAFLSSYIMLLQSTGGKEIDGVVDAYFKTYPKPSTDEDYDLIRDLCLDPASKSHQIFLDNKDVMYQRLGTQLLSVMARYYLKNGLDAKEDIKTIEKKVVKLYPNESSLLSFYLQDHYTKYTKDKQANLANLKNLGDNYKKMGAQELNSLAWNVFEQVDDPAMVKQAILWAQASVARTPEYFNLDTLAWLHNKAGDLKSAKSVAEQAIRKGKEAGEDTKELEALMAK